MDKDSIRLVNIVPVVNGWKTAALKNKVEAQKLMTSGNIPDYNAGLVKSAAADLVAGMAEDPLKVPAVDPVSIRPVGRWVRCEDRDEICIWFGEDGKAHAYNSEFDVTIHCENEQEMNEAVDLLNLANRLHWRKTDVTPPTEEDADECGKVLAVEKCGAFEGAAETWDFDTVAQFPDQYPLWMPMPKLPEVEK